MEFVRPVDFDAAPVSLPGGYRGRFLYHGESCSVIVTRVPPGVAGPPNHVHPTSDQLYFVIEGEITIELGSEIRKPAGPPLHYHAFDQFYFVLSGALHVQIGLTTSEVGPHHLVVLPAGVPHRQWNEGTEAERHLAILAPLPEHRSSPEQPWDLAVTLEASDEVIA
ncbi:MAG: cupin domain-containing protein [Candidatus Dormibacteraeota bacterium]|nr:cupin domain-containing protein [Candidatus Dormibacteraeota bacterium]MBO0759643.1 cupin domain-containing protein [Candidatus Dormibacteraeota bacterium]